MRSFPSLHTGSGDKSQQSLLRLIWISSLFIMLGRGWQHLFFDVPYRAILWDQDWMESIVLFFGWTWDSYITSLAVDHSISLLIQCIGIFYIFAFVITLAWRKIAHWVRQITWAGVWITLIILAFLYSKEKFYSLGQFFEYSLQFGTPFLLWTAFRQKGLPVTFILLVKIFIALTFVSHGLYAIGYYPRPGYFVQMSIHFFKFSESTANLFLWWAGMLDFLAAILIFLPKPIMKIGLIYCVIWGFATAAARLGANLYESMWTEAIFYYTPEFLFRTCHFFGAIRFVKASLDFSFNISALLFESGKMFK